MRGRKAGVDQVDNEVDNFFILRTALYRVRVSVSVHSVSPERSRACTPSQRLRRESGDKNTLAVLYRGVSELSWDVAEISSETGVVELHGGVEPCTISALGLGGRTVELDS